MIGVERQRAKGLGLQSNKKSSDGVSKSMGALGQGLFLARIVCFIESRSLGTAQHVVSNKNNDCYEGRKQAFAGLEDFFEGCLVGSTAKRLLTLVPLPVLVPLTPTAH